MPRKATTHVHPSVVLLVPCLVGITGAILQEDIDYLVVTVTCCQLACPPGGAAFSPCYSIATARNLLGDRCVPHGCKECCD